MSTAASPPQAEPPPIPTGTSCEPSPSQAPTDPRQHLLRALPKPSPHRSPKAPPASPHQHTHPDAPPPLMATSTGLPAAGCFSSRPAGPPAASLRRGLGDGPKGFSSGSGSGRGSGTNRPPQALSDGCGGCRRGCATAQGRPEMERAGGVWEKKTRACRRSGEHTRLAFSHLGMGGGWNERRRTQRLGDGGL